MMSEYRCGWCNKNVRRHGDTCSLQCYEQWYIVLGLNPVIENDDTPPNDMYLQPWFIERKEKE